MPYSMSQASLPVFEIGLTALSNVLDKAASFASAKKIEPSVLLQARLSPDMFALTRQVQIACDLAKNGSARLAGVEAPRFEDNEATIDQLKALLPAVAADVAELARHTRLDAAFHRTSGPPLPPASPRAPAARPPRAARGRRWRCRCRAWRRAMRSRVRTNA